MAATITLRLDAFRKYTKIAGLRNGTAIAEALGVDQGNLSRILAGRQAPGAKFIAACLAAFPDLDFADLFDVVPVDSDEAGAA